LLFSKVCKEDGSFLLDIRVWNAEQTTEANKVIYLSGSLMRLSTSVPEDTERSRMLPSSADNGTRVFAERRNNSHELTCGY